MAATSQIARSNLIVLKEIFILCQVVPLTGQPSPYQGRVPPLSPSEEMCLIMSVYNHLEELPNLEFRYCVFDAVFSGITFNNQSPEHSRGHIQLKMVGLNNVKLLMMLNY